MIVERAWLAALRAGPLQAGCVLQENVNLPFVQLQINSSIIDSSPLSFLMSLYTSKLNSCINLRRADGCLF